MCDILLGIWKQNCPDCKSLKVSFKRWKRINPSFLTWYLRSLSSVTRPLAYFVIHFDGLTLVFLLPAALYSPQPTMFTDPIYLIHLPRMHSLSLDLTQPWCITLCPHLTASQKPSLLSLSFPWLSYVGFSFFPINSQLVTCCNNQGEDDLGDLFLKIGRVVITKI